MAQKKITRDTIKAAVLQVLGRHDNDSIQEADWTELAEEIAEIALLDARPLRAENTPTHGTSELRDTLIHWADVYGVADKYPEVDWFALFDSCAHQMKPKRWGNAEDPGKWTKHADGGCTREIGYENYAISVDRAGEPLRFSPHDDARKRAAYFQINEEATVITLTWGKNGGHIVSFSRDELGPQRFTLFANMFGFIRYLMNQTESLNQVHLESGE